MKSKEKAEEKCSNVCNRSASKYQYSFGREQRFQERVGLARTLLDKFYDLPSEISKKGSIFGRAHRDYQKEKKEQGPPPGQYNPRQLKSRSHVVFAPGRDKCAVSSMFYTTTVKYPGPGKYDPEKPRSKSFIHFGGRAKTSYETISPGPKYNFESTLLDRNKILSKQSRKGSIRLVLPVNKSRLTNSQEAAPFNISVTEGMMMTYKGNQRFGKSGSHITMSRQKRFSSLQMKNEAPGPGQYASFSQFIDECKK